MGSVNNHLEAVMEKKTPLWQDFKKDAHMDEMPGKTGKVLLSAAFPIYVLGRKLSAHKMDTAYQRYVTDKNPLSKAIFYCDEHETFRLINKGLNVRDLKDNMLNLVIKYGNHIGHEKFISKLVALDFHPRYKSEAMISAAGSFNSELLEGLAKAGVNVNTVINGVTPVMKSINCSDVKAFKKLMDMDADIVWGTYPVELVTLSGRVEEVKMNAYELALYRGDEEMITHVKAAYLTKAPHLIKDFDEIDEKIGKIVKREKQEEEVANTGTGLLVTFVIIGGLLMIKGCKKTSETASFDVDTTRLVQKGVQPALTGKKMSANLAGHSRI